MRLLYVLTALALPLAATAQPRSSDTASARLGTCLALVEPYLPNEPALPPGGFGLRLDHRAGGALHAFGVRHSDDPADPQFAAIEEAYRSFRPTVVFYEGPARPTPEMADETIRTYGESGYARWLAARDGVPVARLEPNPADEFHAVAEALGPEQAALFFVLREAARLRDRKGLEGDSLRGAVLDLLGRAAPLGLPITTLDELGAAYGRHFGTPADWADVPGAWFDPRADDTETGGVFMAAANRASSEARNRHMARVVGEAMVAGGRAFVVVGGHHVPKLAPALRCAAE